jgi:hypothetical protein
MTLPASGQIAASDVNVELSKSSTAYITVNDTNVRALAGVTGANTTIRLPQDFWGKSVTITYNVTPDSNNVNEGSSVTFNVSGNNIVNGTYYWTVTNAGDFSVSSGSFTIAGNSGSFSVGPLADNTTEGAESFTASVRTGSTSGTIVATSTSVTINDTSTGPTYSVTPTASSVDEGSSVTFNVTGTNIVNGTYYWTVTNAGDFSASSGAFSITGNSGSFSVGPVADDTTEGAESFTASVRTGSTSGTIVATSTSVTINDTSTTPAPPPPSGPIYYVTPLGSAHNETASYQFTITGSNIPSGTHYYTINHITTSSADFTYNSGYFDISDNVGVVFVYPVADLTTEGNETYSVSIRTGSTSGPVVATSSTVTLIDNSTTPPAGFTPFSNLGGLGSTSWSGSTGLWSGGNQIFEQLFIFLDTDGIWNIYSNNTGLKGSSAYGSPTGANAANSFYCRFTRTSYTAVGGGATSGSSALSSTGWLAINSSPSAFLSLQSSIPNTTTATFTVEVSPNASGFPIASTASNITLTITAR